MGFENLSFNQGYDPDGVSLNLSGSGTMQVKDEGVSDDKIASGLNGDGHITLFPYSPNSVGQGGWNLSLVTSQIFGFEFVNSGSGVDGDNVSYKAYLAKGTYTFKLVFRTGANRGIFKVKIDGVTVHTIDQYNASIIANSIDIQTNITITSSGVKTISLHVDGKNASSSGYYDDFTYLQMYRTA